VAHAVYLRPDRGAERQHKVHEDRAWPWWSGSWACTPAYRLSSSFTAFNMSSNVNGFAIVRTAPNSCARPRRLKSSPRQVEPDVARVDEYAGVIVFDYPKPLPSVTHRIATLVVGKNPGPALSLLAGALGSMGGLHSCWLSTTAVHRQRRELFRRRGHPPGEACPGRIEQ